MERCLQKQMRAENWKWAEGRQTSFVFCCLVESTLYQLLEGFMSRVCQCSSLRMCRRSLFLIISDWSGLSFILWKCVASTLFNNPVWLQQCSNMSIQLSAVVVFWVYCSCCCFLYLLQQQHSTMKEFFFIIVSCWMSWSKYAHSLLLCCTALNTSV